MEAHILEREQPLQDSGERKQEVFGLIFNLWKNPHIIHSANAYLILFQSGTPNHSHKEEPGSFPCLNEFTCHQEREVCK